MKLLQKIDQQTMYFFLVFHSVFCIFQQLLFSFLCSLMAYDCQEIKGLLTYLLTNLLTNLFTY